MLCSSGAGVAQAALPGGEAASVALTISGRVTDATTGTGVGGMCLKVSDFEAGIVLTVASATSKPDGTYSATWSKPSGESSSYIVEGTAYCGAGGWWQPVQSPDVYELTATAGQNTASGVDMQALHGGRLAGRITDDATGAAVRGITISASGTNGAFSQNQTASDGSFVLGGLPTSSVKVAIGLPSCDHGGCYRSDHTYLSEYVPHVPQTQPNNAYQFSVTVGQTTTMNETVLRSDTITGRVTEKATGRPLKNVYVFVFTDGLSPWNHQPADWPEVLTDWQGGYRMPGLGPGDYRVCFQPRAYALDVATVSAHKAACWKDKPMWTGNIVHVNGFGKVVTVNQTLRLVGVN
jgi:hypothetical protein